MGILTEEQIEEIHKLRTEQNLTIAELAKRFHCSMPTVHKAIHALDGEDVRSKRFTGERRDELIADYQRDHPPLSVMARKFNVTKATVRNALVKAGVYEEQNKTQGKTLPSEEEEKFLKDYKEGATLRSLTKKYKRSEYILKQILDKYPEIPRHGERKWTDQELAENEEIIQSYVAGKTITELAKKYNRNEGPIMTLLKHAGIDVATEQARRKMFKQEEREREKFRRKFEQTVRIPYHYEIVCSDHNDAIDLLEQITETLRTSYRFEKDVHMKAPEDTLFIDGEFTMGFHRLMLSQYVDVEDAKRF